MKKKCCHIGIIVSLLLSSCFNEVSSLKINRYRKAIILGNPERVKVLKVEEPDKEISYSGFAGSKQSLSIYFNKKNVNCRIQVSYDSVDNNYILSLKPNSDYKVSAYSKNGDRGPNTTFFKTDNSSNIVELND